MTSLIQRGTGPRFLAAAVGVSLALTLPFGTAMAAAAPAEETLCNAVELEQLDELGSLGLETVIFDSTTLCAFAPTPEGGTPTLSLVITGLSLDSMLGVWTDATEIMVGDRSAVIAEDAVHVDIGDEILSVALDVGGADGGVDPIEYAIAVAEIALAARDAASSRGGSTPLASSLVGPPEVDGIEWGRIQEVVTAQEMIERDEGQAAIWQPMLDAAGADAGELFFLTVNARDAGSNADIGTYAAIRIVGADESTLRTAFLELMATTGEEVAMVDLTLGGKNAQSLAAGDEIRGYLYLVGDIAHTFAMSEEDAARMLEAMP